MPWTNPIPSQPNKQWLYVNDTTSILGNAVNEDSLICWAHAQGYTGLLLYQLNSLTGGGTAFTPANSALLTAFINKCNSQGIVVGGAFGGPNVIQAMIAHGGFAAAVSEIEWWNYSYNLPYQRQDTTGTYSFYDTLQMFITYKSLLNSAGMELITYNGFTKALNFAYKWRYRVTVEDVLPVTEQISSGFRISGNFTTDNTAPIVESNVFQPDEVIKVFNYPGPLLSSYIKLDSTSPTSLVSGQTKFDGVANQVSDGRPLISGTYRVSFQVLSYYVSAGQYYFNLVPGHGLLAGVNIVTDFSVHPEFAFAYKQNSTNDVFISFVSGNIANTSAIINLSGINSYSVSAGTVTLNFNSWLSPFTTYIPTATNAILFKIGDSISVAGLPAGLNGIFTVTNVTSNTVEYSAAVSNTPTTAVDANTALLYTVTRSLQTFPSPVTFYPEMTTLGNTAASVENLHEIVYMGLPRLAGPGAYEIALRGDKTYHFGPGRVSKLAIENFNIPSPANIFTLTGTPVYNAGLNQTRIFLTADPTLYGGSGSEFPGYFLAMANLDVVYESNSSYGAPGSELQQLVPHVDSYALTMYEQNVPYYGYVKNRIYEIAQGISFLIGAFTPKVYYLFGAYNQASLNFYKGLSAGGGNITNPWPKKGAKEAYDYMSFTLSLATTTINIPPQFSSTPISAESETDPDVLAWIQIEGLLMFKSTDLIGQSIKNGPNLLVTGPIFPANTLSVTASPPTGSISLPALTFCDDCLPKVNISKRSRASGVATITTSDPHAFVLTTTIEIAGVGAGYDGTYTVLVPTSGNTFTITNPGPDEVTTNCIGTATPLTTVTWAVTPPVGGTGTLATVSDSTVSCTSSFSNTLNFNGTGLYNITATIKNPLVNGLNPTNDRLITEVVEYQVTVLTSTPDPLFGGASQSAANPCPSDTVGAIEAYISAAPNAGVSPYTYTLHTAFPCTPANQIATSGTTASTTYTFTGLANGTYYVLITDSIGQSQNYAVTLSSDVCTITPYVTNVTCAGGSNGEILLLTDAFDPGCACGLGGFNYSWTYNGIAQPAWDGLNNITGLFPGIYQATVTTCVGCEQVYNLEVLDGGSIVITSTKVFNSTCGEANGAIILDITAPLDCFIPDISNTSWYSGNAGTNYGGFITNISGDGTIVTVTTSGSHNLTSGQLISISGVNPPIYNTVGSNPNFVVLNVLSPTSFTIASTATGLYVSGGIVSNQFFVYDFLDIDDGKYIVSLAGLPAGNYYFTAEGSCGCTLTSPTYTITTTNPPVVTIDEPPGGYIICDDKSQQTLTITGNVTSDCDPNLITYNWINATTGQLYKGTFPLTLKYPPVAGENNLEIGNNTIELQLIDCNGCVVTEFVNVLVTANQNPITSLIVAGGPLTNCPGSTTPYTITVQGGANPATLDDSYWSLDGTPFPAIVNYPTLTVTNDYFNGVIYTPINPAGVVFTYTQIDLNGCEVSSSILVQGPIPVSLAITVTNIACGGFGNTGAIDVEVEQGCPPFTYTWTSTVPGFVNPGTQDLSNLVAGTYSVTVNDSAGNTISSGPIDVIVVSPGIDNVNIVPICNNNANGAVSFDVIDVTGPYSYTWTSVQGGTTDSYTGVTDTSLSFENLKPGNYVFSLEDFNGCTYTTTFFVGNADPIVIDRTIWIPSCFAACDGKIEISVSGGVGAPYTIEWNDGSQYDGLTVREDLCKGIYGVNVTDSNGCTASAGFNLVSNATNPLDFTEIIINPNFENNTLGSIQITSVSNGGGPPYTYVWTDEDGNIIGTDATLSDLNEGTYEVTVTGFPGCSKSRKYTLQGRCDQFSYPEYRLQLYKFQCCAGQLAKKYVELVEIGRTDLAKCLEMDLKYMTVALDTLTCITAFPDPCLSCDDLNTIFNQLKKICDCDCCESDEDAYTVRYDYDTQTFIPVVPQVSGGGVPPPPPPPPPPVPDDLELREDGGTELREDSGNELREN